MTEPEPTCQARRRIPVTVIDPGYWAAVLADDSRLPAGRGLPDLTVELVELLGAVEEFLRADVALHLLQRWIATGIYDDLLPALGDGLSEGLRVGLGEDGTPGVLRRSFSAAALAAVLHRDSAHHRMPTEQVLSWGDRGLHWFTAERDLSPRVPGAGRADALAHGGALIGALASSRHLAEAGLVALLDTLADRVLAPTIHTWTTTDADRLAAAAVTVLHRDLVEMSVLEPWVARLAGAAALDYDLAPQRSNAVSFLRSLHLALLLGVRRPPGAGPWWAPVPAVRVDLLAVLARTLRESAPHLRRAGQNGVEHA
ncbi:MAG: DUF2785 domain-containing protein [Sporichthyaceae bacterium]